MNLKSRIQSIFSINKKSKIGLFGVHGFMENGRISFKTITPILEDMKVDFQFVDVQGHGDDEDINSFNHDLVLKKIEQQYLKFKENHKEVMLIGYSMGGAIAAHLASKYGATKLVLVSAALKYGGTRRLTSQALNVVKKAMSKDVPVNKTATEFLEQNINMNKEEIKKLADDLMESYNVNRKIGSHEDKLSKAKVGVFMEFTKLISDIRSNLGWLDMPVRIYQSTDDELVPIESAYYALELCTNPDRKVIILNKTRHGIMNSVLKEYVMKEIIEFFYGKVI
jgi:carboxylesterase